MKPFMVDPATGTELFTQCVFRLGEQPRHTKWGTVRQDKTGYMKAFSVKYGRPPMPGHCPDHLCNNPQCSNPEHLEEVTYSENHLRGAARGTKYTGGKSSRGSNMVWAAFSAYMRGVMTYEDIYREYGIPAPTLSNWKAGVRRPYLLRRWNAELNA